MSAIVKYKSTLELTVKINWFKDIEVGYKLTGAIDVGVDMFYKYDSLTGKHSAGIEKEISKVGDFKHVMILKIVVLQCTQLHRFNSHHHLDHQFSTRNRLPIVGRVAQICHCVHKMAGTNLNFIITTYN